jgi:uncharacterized protein
MPSNVSVNDAPTPLDRTTLLEQTETLYRRRLGQSFAVAFNPCSDAGPALLNRPALELFNHFKLGATMAQAEAAFPRLSPSTTRQSTEALHHLGLVQCRGSAADTLSSTRPQTLSAWLHLTDRCNLHCAYCYLPHTGSDMSSTTGCAVVRAVVRSAQAHGYRRVKLKYAGGEPLLRLSLIEALHRQAQSLAAEHELEIEGVVLSNGTLLTDDAAERIRACGLNLMISLDGLGKFHDRQRPFADGRGSFETVARAITTALNHDIVPDISVTVSGRNAAGLADLVAWILSKNLPFSFNLYRENGYSATQKDLRLEEERIITGMLAAYRAIEDDLPSRSLLASLADRANLSFPHRHTCSAGRSYLAFTPQGNVAKCQMDMAHPVTNCHVTDPLAVTQQSPIGLRNPDVDEKQECADCLWRYRCGGGCPIQAHRASGRYDAPSPNCTIYQALYPEVVRLEGLRLLVTL